jgi:hypothetical protein
VPEAPAKTESSVDLPLAGCESLCDHRSQKAARSRILDALELLRELRNGVLAIEFEFPPGLQDALLKNNSALFDFRGALFEQCRALLPALDGAHQRSVDRRDVYKQRWVLRRRARLDHGVNGYCED